MVVDISTQQFCKKSSNTSEKQFYNGWFLPRNSTTIGELDWNWEKRKKVTELWYGLKSADKDMILVSAFIKQAAHVQEDDSFIFW